MDFESDRAKLRTILTRRSVRTGDFTLVSGQKSSVYVDCKLTTLHGEAMPLIGRVFLSKMAENEWSPRLVGGLTLGADPIALAIAHESFERRGGPPIDAFIVRKTAKKHGTQRFIEGLEDPAGVPVVVLDDVCTTGDSTAQAIEQARAAGMNVLGALCLVDRESGAAERLWSAFECRLDSIFKLSELTGSL